MNSQAITRRNMLKSSGLLALSSTISPVISSSAASPPDPNLDTNIYESIGVRPIINCRGTFTIISGSQSLPETKEAMDRASRHYVQMDELMEAVSKRLAELTQAEWGIVTAGCAAAITNATAACVAGANPERMQRLPNLEGLKNEVIMAKYSRNEYDHATRMIGVKVIEINSYEELVNAFNPRTAMVLILSSPAAEKGSFNLETTCRVAKNKGVPVFVDAAAENLTIPNIHLQRGATMVGYSGGKCLRGPQCAGLLLGKKDLLQAAWLNSASAPCVWTLAKGWKRRNHGHAGGRGNVDQARP
jgi:L-seryl-tRNA(Ser) seleniumtransferase